MALDYSLDVEVGSILYFPNYQLQELVIFLDDVSRLLL